MLLGVRLDGFSKKIPANVGSDNGKARGVVIAIFQNHNPANTANHDAVMMHGPLANDYKDSNQYQRIEKKDHAHGLLLLEKRKVSLCQAEA